MLRINYESGIERQLKVALHELSVIVTVKALLVTIEVHLSLKEAARFYEQLGRVITAIKKDKLLAKYL